VLGPHRSNHPSRSLRESHSRDAPIPWISADVMLPPLLKAWAMVRLEIPIPLNMADSARLWKGDVSARAQPRKRLAQLGSGEHRLAQPVEVGDGLFGG
jgi:hypothetical protein